MHHVGEQDGDLFVFSPSSHLCEWRAALVTELGVWWQFDAARPTEQPRRGPFTATIPAGVHVSIISPLVNDRAAHHWSQAKLKTQAGLFQRLHWPAGSASRLAFSPPAIVVRSVVPSSNFPESGRAARATTIIPPFGATSTPICPTRELPVDKPDLLPGRRGKQLHIKSEEGDYILGFESSTSSLHGHWFRIGDPNFGDGFTLPLNTSIGVVSCNPA